MNLRTCDCGLAPVMHLAKRGNVYTTEIRCECGHKTAVLMHTRPEDHARMQQAAADVWNLGPPW